MASLDHPGRPENAAPIATRLLWLAALRRYAAVAVALNLAWEVLHLPLYTLWDTGSISQIVYAVTHCTVGDGLIALSTLSAGLVTFGAAEWPQRRFFPVAAAAVVLGVAYTAYSEHLNVALRGAWAYADAMPRLRAFGLQLGLSPILQWLVVPALSFWITRRSLGGWRTDPAPGPAWSE